MDLDLYIETHIKQATPLSGMARKEGGSGEHRNRRANSGEGQYLALSPLSASHRSPRHHPRIHAHMQTQTSIYRVATLARCLEMIFLSTGSYMFLEATKILYNLWQDMNGIHEYT